MAFDKNFQTVVDWSIRVMSPIVLGFLGWMVAEMADIQDHAVKNTERLVAIESNRYTTSDALRDQQKLWDRLDGIKIGINDLERRLPTRAEFDATNELIKALREDVRSLKQ